MRKVILVGGPWDGREHEADEPLERFRTDRFEEVTGGLQPGREPDGVETVVYTRGPVSEDVEGQPCRYYYQGVG